MPLEPQREPVPSSQPRMGRLPDPQLPRRAGDRGDAHAAAGRAAARCRRVVVGARHRRDRQRDLRRDRRALPRAAVHAGGRAGGAATRCRRPLPVERREPHALAAVAVPCHIAAAAARARSADAPWPQRRRVWAARGAAGRWPSAQSPALLGWRSAIAPVSLDCAGATARRPSSAGGCSPRSATARSATPRRAARRTPAGAPWRRPSAPSTPPTSRPTPTPASAAGRSAPSSARCAKACRATAITCTRPSRTPRSPRPATTTCRRCTPTFMAHAAGARRRSPKRELRVSVQPAPADGRVERAVPRPGAVSPQARRRAPSGTAAPTWSTGWATAALATRRATRSAPSRAAAPFLSGAMVDGWEAPALTAGRRRRAVDGRRALPATCATAMRPSTAAPAARWPRWCASCGGARRRHARDGGLPGVLQCPRALTDRSERAGARAVQTAAAHEDRLLGPAQRLFDSACAACHHDGDGPTLLGVNTPLALNSKLTSDAPDNLLRTILEGVREPATQDIGFMPAFRDALDDAQIAELAGYMRARFAPQARHGKTCRPQFPACAPATDRSGSDAECAFASETHHAARRFHQPSTRCRPRHADRPPLATRARPDAGAGARRRPARPDAPRAHREPVVRTRRPCGAARQALRDNIAPRIAALDAALANSDEARRETPSGPGCSRPATCR